MTGRERDWTNILFLLVTPVIGLGGTALYASLHGVAWWEPLLFLTLYLAVGLAVGSGYHRCFAHRAFECTGGSRRRFSSSERWPWSTRPSGGSGTTGRTTASSIRTSTPTTSGAGRPGLISLALPQGACGRRLRRTCRTCGRTRASCGSTAGSSRSLSGWG